MQNLRNPIHDLATVSNMLRASLGPISSSSYSVFSISSIGSSVNCQFTSPAARSFSKLNSGINLTFNGVLSSQTFDANQWQKARYLFT